jgi:hypothetical protein
MSEGSFQRYQVLDESSALGVFDNVVAVSVLEYHRSENTEHLLLHALSSSRERTLLGSLPHQG